jgi:nicotinate-nucleotide pyrophosphorylase (carboxylating)
MKYAEFDDIIQKAFDEDIAMGDITTLATIPESAMAKAEFLIKADGIIAGLDFIEYVFHKYDSSIKFDKRIKDGSPVKYGDVAAYVEGKARAILTVERTALNFIQRMSGIATMSHIYSEAVKHTKVQILDTRKTVPGLRNLDKLAVKLGGSQNHRIGLYDMFLIKDNHIAVSGSITKAVEAAREFMKKNGGSFKIEAETTNLDQVKEAVACKVDMIMLDNFTTEKMKEAVKYINGACKVEASGGVSLNTVKEIAETGVDYISVGALTHSVKALDISLNITIQK